MSEEAATVQRTMIEPEVSQPSLALPSQAVRFVLRAFQATFLSPYLFPYPTQDFHIAYPLAHSTSLAPHGPEVEAEAYSRERACAPTARGRGHLASCLRGVSFGRGMKAVW